MCGSNKTSAIAFQIIAMSDRVIPAGLLGERMLKRGIERASEELNAKAMQIGIVRKVSMSTDTGLRPLYLSKNLNKSSEFLQTIKLRLGSSISLNLLWFTARAASHFMKTMSFHDRSFPLDSL